MIAKYNDPDAWVQPDQLADEFAALLNLYCEVKPKYVLEIGVREGGTLYQWMKHARPKTTIIGIDLPFGKWGNGYKTDFGKFWQLAGHKSVTISVLLGNSHHPSTKRAISHAMPFVDWLFIDGDHTFEGVKDDFEFYSQLVTPNGVIALHDIIPDATDGTIQVSAFWDWIKEGYHYQEFTSGPGQRSHGIGVIVK